jgi:hypothetical protein
MKKILLLLLITVVVSCEEKEIEEPTYPTTHTHSTIDHYAYFEGMVSDSLTGLPITGYYIGTMSCPNPSKDTLINGTYFLYCYWFESSFLSYQKPKTVSVHLVDSAYNIFKTMTFNGNLLVENDTINVDFQISL